MAENLGKHHRPVRLRSLALYVLMILVRSSAFIRREAKRSIDFGVFTLPPSFIAVDQRSHPYSAKIHRLAAYLLIGLASFHGNRPTLTSFYPVRTTFYYGSAGTPVA